MNIAVTSKGAGLGAWLDPDFDHCLQVVIVDEDDRFQSWPGPAQSGSEDAAKSLAEQLVMEPVGGVVTGVMSPAALEILHAGGVRIFLAQQGSVLQLVGAARDGSMLPVGPSTTHSASSTNPAEV
jgi:predicted Fe-Mo cluster-binding NifX family protein